MKKGKKDSLLTYLFTLPPSQKKTGNACLNGPLAKSVLLSSYHFFWTKIDQHFPFTPFLTCWPDLFLMLNINEWILAPSVAPIVSGNCNVWYTLIISVSVCKRYVYNFKQNLHNVPACGIISVDRCGLDKTSKWERPKSKWQWKMRKKKITLRKRKPRNDDDEKREGGEQDLVMRGRPRKPIANSPSTATLPPPPTHSFKLYLFTLLLLLSFSYSPTLNILLLFSFSFSLSLILYSFIKVKS